MRILKVINNNVISSMDSTDTEVVIMGKGIGFQKKIGDAVDEGKIEKIFHLSKESTGQFEDLVENIPYEHVKLAQQIVQYCREKLGKHLNKNIYITLTDHLNYAISRKREGVEVRNALLWEIKKFYKLEFLLGLDALKMVEEKLGVSLPEDEAGFIAIHLVNAEMDSEIGDSRNIPEYIKDILTIVRYSFRVEPDENSLAYERFVTHLKFMFQRLLSGQMYDEDDIDSNRDVITKCKDEYQCVLKIKDYVYKRLNLYFSSEEEVYLTVHIARVIKKTKH